MTASLVFVILYAAALAGWLRPVADTSLAARLEPVIFVLIGYYIGQLPIAQLWRSRTNDIDRLVMRLDEVQKNKEQVQRERDALAEKISNAKIALDRLTLKPAVDVLLASGPGSTSSPKSAGEDFNLTPRTVEIVRNILDS